MRLRRQGERERPTVPECPHCGHAWMIGLTHDDTACELKRLRRSIEMLTAAVNGGDAGASSATTAEVRT